MGNQSLDFCNCNEPEPKLLRVTDKHELVEVAKQCKNCGGTIE